MVYHITGASGYFAGNFIYHNSAELKTVGCVLYDLKDLPPKLKDFDYCFIKGDINQTLGTNGGFKPGDVLINFASYSHVDYSFLHHNLVYNNNCSIGMTIRDIIKRYPFLYVIHISTDEIYTCSSPYSKSKLQQEKYIKSVKTNRVIILRFNNLYGNTQSYPIIQTQPCLIPNTIKKQSIIKQGNTEINTRNFMFIGDAINYVKKHVERIQASFAKQSDKNMNKVYELYFGRIYTVAQIQYMLEELFKKHNMIYKVLEIPDREINDTSYPTFNVFDESEATFKYHLEETFKFIVNDKSSMP